MGVLAVLVGDHRISAGRTCQKKNMYPTTMKIDEDKRSEALFQLEDP
jgi:hypothetical protein